MDGKEKTTAEQIKAAQEIYEQFFGKREPDEHDKLIADFNRRLEALEAKMLNR